MHNDQRIGVGIITYNRPEKFRRLYDYVANIEYIDCIVIVKNKDVDYGDNDPTKMHDRRLTYIHVPGDVGVGKCKNEALHSMMDNGCKHLFLVEDDIILKKDDVFKQYIDTAKEFNLGHLNFCRAWDSITKKYLFPFATVPRNGHEIQLFRRLCGDFQYFTDNAINVGGYINDVDYINAFEHAEHTYRMSLLHLYTPFNAFADIANSNEWIEDDGVQSSIDHDEQLYKIRVNQAMVSFVKQYGYMLNQIPVPSIENLKIYFSK